MRMEEWFVDPLLPVLLNTRKNSNARGATANSADTRVWRCPGVPIHVFLVLASRSAYLTPRDPTRALPPLFAVAGTRNARKRVHWTFLLGPEMGCRELGDLRVEEVLHSFHPRN